jgi:hypothetical protein
MLTKAQQNVMSKMQTGSVIGELSDKINGRYELFTRKPNCFPESHHQNEHPFEIKSINKNTVFALLTLGLIRKDNEIAESMLPFGRDCWYVKE